jgi:2'-5' RNA ligase
MMAQRLLTLLEQYKSACLLVPVDPVTAQHAMRLRRPLLPYLDAEEDDKESYFPHVTVFYGFKDDDASVVQRCLAATKTDLVTVRPDPRVFVQETHYVVYFPVDSTGLVKLHYQLREVTGRQPTYDTYTPHCTVAYIRKDAWGAARRLCRQFHSAPTTFVYFKAFFGLTNETKIPMFFKQ